MPGSTVPPRLSVGMSKLPRRLPKNGPCCRGELASGRLASGLIMATRPDTSARWRRFNAATVPNSGQSWERSGPFTERRSSSLHHSRFINSLFLDVFMDPNSY